LTDEQILSTPCVREATRANTTGYFWRSIR